MFEARTYASTVNRRKPKIMVDKTFMSLDGVDVGDKGQLTVSLYVASKGEEMDGDGNDILKYQLRINKVDGRKLPENQINAPTPLGYDARPMFDAYETSVAGLSDKKVGMSFNAILNYRVIERTKSFATLGINHIHILDTNRIY